MLGDQLAACQSGRVHATEARRLLGVKSTVTRTDLRAAYRRLMRRSHPDVTGDPDAHERAACLSEAYEVVNAAIGIQPPVPRCGPPRCPDERTTSPHAVKEHPVGGTSAETFHPTLLEACSFIGDIIGVDRSDQAVQVRIEAEGYGDSCLLVQLEERKDDLVAVCALESFDGGPAPRIADVVADLHRALTPVGS